MIFWYEILCEFQTLNILKQDFCGEKMTEVTSIGEKDLATMIKSIHVGWPDSPSLVETN